MKNYKKSAHDGQCRNSRSALFHRNRALFMLSMLGVLFMTLFVLGFSSFIQKILDTISGENVSSIPSLIVYGGICVGFLLIRAIFEYAFWTAFRNRALTQYRHHTYRKILQKSIVAWNRESSAAYLSALSNDLNEIKDNYIEILPYLAELILNFIGTACLMLYYDVKLAGIAFLISLLPIALSSFRMRAVADCEEKLSIANSSFLGSFAQTLRGFKAIKSMRAEAQIADRLLTENKKASDAFSNREHVEIAVAYTASLSGHIAQLVFFFISMILARSDPRVSVGVIVAFIQLMRNISQLAIAMPELLAKLNASKKLMTRNDRLLESHQIAGKDVQLSCDKQIELRGLSAGYGGSENTLRNINITLPAKGCYAILGESGSGKTTLLNLLSGIHRDYAGQILFDGADIRDVCGESIFALVSVLHQDVFLFDATLKDNITLFLPIPEDALQSAIEKAGLAELVAEKGLSYPCGENGNMLSGGEKQRIGIARSILQGTNVLLLDEATAALDSQTGSQIMEAVQKMRDKTRIVVTHDIFPELMDNFDCVFVLKDGKIADAGKYSELLLRG
ncbi:MAG: ABC transporter ATP-binding protein/permease [Oscillospiraceae bacterium]|jgi:ABC-type multidrug transport system fused ATPase/permease subunit|nr:ABC transporter ATP-binding protein/permease [Oscillospiraceae bacterium]